MPMVHLFRQMEDHPVSRRLPALAILLALAACAAPRPPAAPIPALVPIPPAPPRGEPDRFSNIGVTQLRALLGAPAFVRKDGATEMWRYDAPSCHAFFFIYGSGAQQQVRHIETLPAGTSVAADPACLNALKKS
jgi:hypothetical protein